MAWRIRIPSRRSIRNAVRQRRLGYRPSSVHPARAPRRLINMLCTQCRGQGIAAQTETPCAQCGGSGFC